MIKREIERTIQMEKYIQSLNDHKIQNNLLKQDFYTYEMLHKEADPLFQSSCQPQDRIFSLIQNCQMGSYDELEQIQSRLSYMQSLQWHFDSLAELKNKYLKERRQIVNSGLTIHEGIGQLSAKDPFTDLIKTYFKNKQYQNQFIWQFMDQIFNTFEKNPINSEIRPSKTDYTQHDNQQNYQRLKDLMDILKKLTILVKPNYQQLEQSVKKLVNQNQ